MLGFLVDEVALRQVSRSLARFSPANIDPPTLHIYVPITDAVGHAVAQLVEALRYKPEGRGFDSR